jgi:hypothetical protein
MLASQETGSIEPKDVLPSVFSFRAVTLAEKLANQH